ncbi:hypothetical protein [Zunongwangia endophytica]|uniref:Lipocalin-like domain-containing protein n=1 Tax=Zunongwangia endophytica TaxID=1808945 RepID=A0ABV8H753_9FLAO|nr:hypothetical protein [Zunongwangia endophytica]MDN3595758.1 hypothetical protein [Zunongwangia endophytica]
MKVNICLILVFLGIHFMNAQDIEGVWQWSSPDGTQNFEVELERINDKEYRGNHCAIFDNGDRIDCNSEQDTFSIVMVKIAEDNYAGTIESSYEQSQGKIRMQYYVEEDLLHFNLTENPVGIFYLPEEAILTR